MRETNGRKEKPPAAPRKRSFRTLSILTGLVAAAFVALVLAFQFLNMDLNTLADTYRDTWVVIPLLLGAYLLKACTSRWFICSPVCCFLPLSRSC